MSGTLLLLMYCQTQLSFGLKVRPNKCVLNECAPVLQHQRQENRLIPSSKITSPAYLLRPLAWLLGGTDGNNFLLSLLIGAWIGKNSRSSRGSCKPRISKSPKIAKAVCVRRIHLYFRHFPCPHSQRLRSHSKICRWEGRRSTKDRDFPQIPSNWMVLIFHPMNFKARTPFEPRWPNLILFGLSVESEVWITVLLACWTAGFLTDLHREIWTSWSPAKDRTLQLEANWKVIKPQHIMKVTVAYRVPTMYQALKQALCIHSVFQLANKTAVINNNGINNPNHSHPLIQLVCHILQAFSLASSCLVFTKFLKHEALFSFYEERTES